MSRQFGAVRALTYVSFDCRAGEVHALVGENGSGKSTLLGIASGFVEPDRGTVRIGGRAAATRLTCTRPQARAWPWPTRTARLFMAEPVKNNLFYAAHPRTARPIWRRKKWARKLLAEFDLDLELFPDSPAGSLTLAERQLFEVAKALVTNPRCCSSTSPPRRSVRMRSRPFTEPSWRAETSRHRCGLRQPSSARSARGSRPDHGAS